jgi:[glutamine synthetase] adenylyltransferase / [glutamine synthetase]-adenylyl-L-tyrosine phosphorylase
MSIPIHLIRDLPDAEAAHQFIDRLGETHPSPLRKLLRNEALLSDILTLVAYSPLLATTLLQNPDYILWLNRRRNDKGLRGKEELLESLARFSLTNSSLDIQVMFARFRRRELLRIYLADIRRQLTIAEITEELSNLADAVLESALRVARQEMDNRFGAPQELDDKGRERLSQFCIVTLGKLGSRELNYSSDIDLLFLYSSEGNTSGTGVRGKITNREYFVKLAELIAKLIGQQIGEGATYRVDLRLRPHGRVGPLAMSVADTVRYYQTEAADWERQVLIRSRSGAGDANLFARMFAAVEPHVFAESQSVAAALRSVRRSKQKIDLEHLSDKGFDAKLGKGGIREIEFIAQALQLAYGGRDRWLRAGHTLISLGRLADRGFIDDSELSQLYDAYEFLRRLEHILQMENGLQTHLVPNDPVRRRLVARRMRCADTTAFDESLIKHSANVHRIFRRIFSDENIESAELHQSFADAGSASGTLYSAHNSVQPNALAADDIPSEPVAVLTHISPRFAGLIGSLAVESWNDNSAEPAPDYRSLLLSTIGGDHDLGSRLASLRIDWRNHLIGIAALDAAGLISPQEAKRRQTQLAEASIAAALEIARAETERRTSHSIGDLNLAVMGVGKLGGAGLDYESDLDLVLVFDDTVNENIAGLTPVEFFSRTAEIFVNALSSYTREGHLYRVDLRLRPHGKNGPNAISLSSFAAYMRETAAIWELLAYVKLRAAGGGEFAERVETHITDIVHQRAADIPADDLARETRRVRLMLEKERTPKRASEVNIKHGPGGMLDIYFAIRFLQLRDNVPDDPDARSSDLMLQRLRKRGSISQADFDSLHSGYRFLSLLDHAMRLIIGRSYVVPHSGHPHLPQILARLGLSSVSGFSEALAVHRISIREAFDSITA